MLKSKHRSSEVALNNKIPRVESIFTRSLTDLAASYNIGLTPAQMGALVVPHAVASFTCFAWMQLFFKAVDDKQPNHNEIHLEPTDMNEVHIKYEKASYS